MASGNKPKTVVIAVSNTGLKRVLPDSTIVSLISGIVSTSFASIPLATFFLFRSRLV